MKDCIKYGRVCCQDRVSCFFEMTILQNRYFDTSEVFNKGLKNYFRMKEINKLEKFLLSAALNLLPVDLEWTSMLCTIVRF